MFHQQRRTARPARFLFPASPSAANAMTSTSPRTALSVLVLIGLTAACGSGNKRREPPGTVTAEDFDQNPGQRIEEVLQAKVPGLLVTRTSSGDLAIQIRGTSSFMSSNEPLYVIDDVPIKPGPGGALTGVNPYDIESIQVLKNPADIAIYGVRGANGVIVIKTKKPGRRSD
jgi:TonB-dependent SusC/RagA subfamily outer membrane receptor